MLLDGLRAWLVSLDIRVSKVILFYQRHTAVSFYPGECLTSHPAQHLIILN